MPARRDTNRPSGVNAVRPSPQEVIVEVARGHTQDWIHRVPVTTGKYATFQPTQGGAARCFLAPRIEVQGPSDIEPSFIVHHEIVMTATRMILGCQVQGPRDLRGIGLAVADLGQYYLTRNHSGKCEQVILRSRMSQGLLGVTAQTIANAAPDISVDLHVR